MLYELNKYIIELLIFAEYHHNKKQIMKNHKKLEKLIVKETYLVHLVDSIQNNEGVLND
tara:strand:- start:7533 stop:7709 length:177 start_codon:yes stop_codon:yes gene_type:complete